MKGGRRNASTAANERKKNVGCFVKICLIFLTFHFTFNFKISIETWTNKSLQSSAASWQHRLQLCFEYLKGKTECILKTFKAGKKTNTELQSLEF
jgi:hypothetical protein